MPRSGCFIIFVVPTLLFAASVGVAQQPSNHHSKSGPIGQIFQALKDDPRLKKVGVAGLRTGSLAAYSEHGQNWTFFEIDEDVKKIAEDPKRFPFLRDAKAKIRVEMGDPRLTLERSKDKFGLLVIDCIDADAIQIHLMTREAIILYRDHLSADGILVFHLPATDLDLEAAMGNVAADAKWVGYFRSHAPTDREKKLGVTASDWLVMAQTKENLDSLLKTNSWQPARTNAGVKAWTDDYSNILGLMRSK